MTTLSSCDTVNNYNLLTSVAVCQERPFEVRPDVLAELTKVAGFVQLLQESLHRS